MENRLQSTVNGRATDLMSERDNFKKIRRERDMSNVKAQISSVTI